MSSPDHLFSRDPISLNLQMVCSIVEEAYRGWQEEVRKSFKTGDSFPLSRDWDLDNVYCKDVISVQQRPSPRVSIYTPLPRRCGSLTGVLTWRRVPCSLTSPMSPTGLFNRRFNSSLGISRINLEKTSFVTVGTRKWHDQQNSLTSANL